MFKGRRVLINHLDRSLEPSFKHIVLNQRCKSTKSAIHAALHDQNSRYANRNSAPRRTRENLNLAEDNLRDHGRSKGAIRSGDWNQRGGRREQDALRREEDEGAFGRTKRLEGFTPMQRFRDQDSSPFNIPYTTSASEFLYGQGVVTAALRARRRQFYKLYMFQQPKRKEYEGKDQEMKAMAFKAGVRVEKIGPERFRMLDKMSEGRPHNVRLLSIEGGS